ncbi:hypothetical protein [Paenibacillus sp. MMO-177]
MAWKPVLEQIKDMDRIAKNEPNEQKAKQLIMAYLREMKKHVPENMKE